MSNDIGPGDWVEMVGGDLAGEDEVAFTVGVAYEVEDAFPYGSQFGLLIVGMRSPHPTGAFDGSCFRKINRPSEKFMRLLLAPVRGPKVDA